jgi:hypothetical protein
MNMMMMMMNSKVFQKFKPGGANMHTDSMATNRLQINRNFLEKRRYKNRSAYRVRFVYKVPDKPGSHIKSKLIKITIYAARLTLNLPTTTIVAQPFLMFC